MSQKHSWTITVRSHQWNLCVWNEVTNIIQLLYKIKKFNKIEEYEIHKKYPLMEFQTAIKMLSFR